MEKENLSKKEKIVKVAKGFKIASQVLYVLSCVSCLAFIVLAIVMPLAYDLKRYTQAEVALIFSGLALSAFFLIGVLWNVWRIFDSIEKGGSPFSDKVTKYVKKTGLFVMLMSFIPALLQNIFVSIFAKDSEVYTTIRVGGVVAGLVLYLLGYFFDYGAELQKKNDEKE